MIYNSSSLKILGSECHLSTVGHNRWGVSRGTFKCTFKYLGLGLRYANIGILLHGSTVHSLHDDIAPLLHARRGLQQG